MFFTSWFLHVFCGSTMIDPKADQAQKAYHVLCGREAQAALRNPTFVRCDIGKPSCKTKSPPDGGPSSASISRKSGAGEGIRTLDPDLGKVVLYP
jgi:hypothetical protein